MKVLRGITWDHPRGYAPLPETAKHFAANHPDVRIDWHKRSLHEFGAMPVDELARKFDLVVLDHPWVGFIAGTGCYLPMDELLSQATLQDLARHSAGPSHQTYEYEGHQWALAIDAATPSASYRPDLLKRFSDAPPTTWGRVIELGQAAQRAGLRIGLPLGPVDAITVFLSLADNIGATLFSNGHVVDRDSGHRVLHAMRAVTILCGPDALEMTPVSLMDRMSTRDDLVYCPLAYSYNNYSREGFRKHVCFYADMPALGDDGPKGSHIGGTGLAISSHCKHRPEAAAYAAYVASGSCQRAEYFLAGGQPAHSDAWDDANVNRLAHDFFKNTRQTIERAYVRPRYNGYIDFQYPAGRLIQVYLRNSGDADTLLRDLDALYQSTLGASA